MLERFVTAQNPVYESVKAELRAGRKRGHWMWFVFPQLSGLGQSEMAHRYAIASLAQAKEYLNHELLGARLRECTELVLAVQKATLFEIFGSPDDMKFKSCMTLFAKADPHDRLFVEALRKYCGGEFDDKSLELLDII